MFEKLLGLVKRYRAFYEVLPYYVVIEEGHGSPKMTRRTIKAGFDVDVHGISDKEEMKLPPPAEYAYGYAGLKEIADAVSHHAGESSIEVIPFPSTIFLEPREHFPPEAVIRIRISHCRGIDQPAGPPEQNALEAVENELKSLGIRRR